MTFRFSWFCELLDELENQKYLQRATSARQDDPAHRIVANWYNKYDRDIVRHGAPAVALLSALFPERRPDRTYNLKERRLSSVFGRCLLLGHSRQQALHQYEHQNGPDFAMCVQRVMAESEFPFPRRGTEITLEEIDSALTKIAANARASAPSVRMQVNGEDVGALLNPIIRRLKSAEAKWFVRMIFKSYGPVEIPEYAALHNFHFMLPRLLKIQNSFEACVATLGRPELTGLPPRPSKSYEVALLPLMYKELTPTLGTMIQRQPLYKARSIKHCVKMAASKTMSIERKYDGEYCQIHVDRSRGTKCIQIFSKNGRDSTEDRFGLVPVIKQGLGLHHGACNIKTKAILEGELLVYSRAKQMIMPFYHIRKHVLHGLRRIGTEADSPPRVGEQLMIVFFDLLLLDDHIMVNEPHRVRRQYLKGIVTQIQGTSQIVERALINFASAHAHSTLRGAFAAAIRKRWEGYVLKGLEDPYISWKEDAVGIKLKKDYITGLGDIADLCIVGAASGPSLDRPRSTYFYVACLLNKHDVNRHDEKPVFKILDRIGPESMSREALVILDEEGRSVVQPYVSTSKYMNIQHSRKDLPEPTEMFTKPIIVEIMGAGFERPQTVDFFTLRFPRTQIRSTIKLHRDRDIGDTVGFDELQAMAAKTFEEIEEAASQEDIKWIERLEAADPKLKYLVDKSQSISPTKTPLSATTISLTPAATRKASTQPSPILIRMDSDELTPEDWYDQLPSSAPQTPSRQSEATASPRSTVSRVGKKRKMAEVDQRSRRSVAPKRRRVDFASPVHVYGSPSRSTPRSSPLADSTNRPTARRSRDASKSPTKNLNDVQNQIRNVPSAIQGAFLDGTSEQPDHQPRGALPTPPSTEEAGVQEGQKKHPLPNPQRPATRTPIPSSSPLPDWRNVFEHVMSPLSSLPPPLPSRRTTSPDGTCALVQHPTVEIEDRTARQKIPYNPVFIAPSAVRKLDQHNTTTNFEAEPHVTQSIKKWLRSLASRDHPDDRHAKQNFGITLVDSSEPGAATGDLLNIIRSLSRASSQTSSSSSRAASSNSETRRGLLCSQILIFDVRLLLQSDTDLGPVGGMTELLSNSVVVEPWFVAVLKMETEMETARGAEGASNGRRRKGWLLDWDRRLTDVLAGD